ncbi:SAM-dependent methyltransferase [Vicingus serpentipes]|uniref:SAM-dependent methyltransferase n=1 Tax=Vicingus serpentipes TaxID=1926625 RepID=A0A5C6RQW0_9FLAO|nr:SAM-dependent methyltransferase [Vicingus serpentipes]TXB64731.1 SAM-dependent methyltransferase [Vicingus serpentipes]
MNDRTPFFEKISESFNNETFVKITLSKPAYKSDGLLNVYVRLIEIKGEQQLSFTYHYQTNDQVKNYNLKGAQEEINKLLDGKFRAAILFTLDEDFTLQLSKKGKVSTRTTHPSFKNKPPQTHDKPKTKRAALGKYLTLLGVCDESGMVIPKMADKFKQINKYLEIIEGLIKNTKLPNEARIVDMGSGKGYLTFALYDYLVNQRKIDVKITGIELRQELVDFCNETAKKCGFENLKFEAKPIEQYNKKIDVLIALHACDTATDDAIYKGLTSNSELIITAPCCHKQIRQQLKGKEQQNPILKYGIFKERQYEMVTDTLRALIMEKHKYNTNIFEFISNEHTRKNVMLVGTKSSKKADLENLNSKIEAIKSEYGIEEHYLEKY